MSHLQVGANIQNAKKSTGPVTPEGKATSSKNRLSHGFASSTRFIHDEDPEEFNALLDDLAAASGTVAHECLVRLNARAERRYVG